MHSTACARIRVPFINSLSGLALIEQLPRVTVLVAAFNGLQWISQQLDSILAQQEVAVSVIISIDPSTDGTLQLCQRYAAEYVNVTLASAGGPFGCAARNFFHLLKQTDLTATDFVALSDQDDLWHPDKLARAIRRLQETGVGGYSSNVTAFWPDGRRVLLKKSQPQVNYDYLFEAAGPGCTYVLPSNIAQLLQHDLQAADERLWEVDFHDWYIYAWVRSRRMGWIIDPVPSMEYRQHPSNQLGANTNIKSFLRRWQKVGSGGWFEQVRLIANLTRQSSSPRIYDYIKFSATCVFSGTVPPTTSRSMVVRNCMFTIGDF
jgi:rhamnosyltransferase